MTDTEVRIPVEKVQSVLLADGWHKVAEGSFRVGSGQYYKDGKMVPDCDRMVAAEWSVPPGGKTISCPIKSILAVEYASPHDA